VVGSPAGERKTYIIEIAMEHFCSLVVLCRDNVGHELQGLL
jgi:hypothetical protein